VLGPILGLSSGVNRDVICLGSHCHTEPGPFVNRFAGGILPAGLDIQHGIGPDDCGRVPLAKGRRGMAIRVDPDVHAIVTRTFHGPRRLAHGLLEI